jgi:hypothetical protein
MRHGTLASARRHISAPGMCLLAFDANQGLLKINYLLQNRRGDSVAYGGLKQSREMSRANCRAPSPKKNVLIGHQRFDGDGLDAS